MSGEIRLPKGIPLWDVEALAPYARNPRTHSSEQVQQIAASIVAYGFNSPIGITASGGIVTGHGRLEAAKLLGMTQVPVLDLSHLTPEEVRAYVIADNQIATHSGWDLDLLRGELAALPDPTAVGFTQEELDALNAQWEREQGAEYPRAQEPPAEPITKLGDLWLLGRHRLLCGDATVAGDLARLLGGDKPRLCVTDPPYGIDYHPEWRNEAAEKGLITFAARRTGAVPGDDRADWRQVWAMIPSEVLYCWHAATFASVVQDGIVEAGFAVRGQIIWAKDHLIISRGHYHWQHEAAWYAVRVGADAGWIGDRSQTTLWEVSFDENAPGGHSTQKPVELMARPIANHTGDVLDPFIGSGSTLIAAEALGRRCFAMDIDPGYCDVVVARWEQMTGERASLG